MKKIILTIAMLSSVAVAMAQSRRVSGVVKDESGEPVPGATIRIKGTDAGAVVSDVDGSFTIEVPEDRGFLTITSFDTEPIDVRIGDKDNYEVKLLSKNSSNDLDGVTVYGKKIDRRSYTGALNTVSSQQIANRPVTSVGAALDGAAPGLLVTSGGGQPGSNPDILLRGQGSLSASSSPLIVLDGAPYSGALNTINPLDIKEIVVLKDATAKAVYGARAANGVILITTKRGEKSDKPRINFDASVGVLNRFIPEYELLGTRDYYEVAWRAYIADNPSGTSADFITYLGGYNAYKVDNESLMDPTTGKVIPSDDQLRWTDSWEEEMQRIGVRQNYNLSVQNGNDNSDYYLSIGYTRDQGIVKNSDYNRITALLNVNSKVTDWLNTGFKMQAAYDDQLFLLGSGTAYSNPFYASRTFGSIYPVYRYDLDGNRLMEPDGVTPVYDFGDNNDQFGVQNRPFGRQTNAVAALTYNRPYTVALNGNAVGFLEAKIYRDLTAKATMSINYRDANQLNYYNSVYGDAANVLGRSTRSNTRNINYTFNQFITWKPQANNLNQSDSSDHSFQLTVGHENYNWMNTYVYARRIGFPLPNNPELDLAATGEGSGSQIDRLRIETYFAQAEYNFKRKYYLSGSYSRNGSSRFSPSARWGDFGSAGAGWILSEESFIKDWSDKHFDMLKLRVSWGVSGNDQINGYYSWLTRFSALHNASNPGLAFANYGNDDLKWEGSVDMNLGLDVVTKGNKFSGSIDVYNRGSNNLLYIFPLAPSVGSTGYYANVGSMRNRGIELTLTYDVLRPTQSRPGGLYWNTRLNLAHNRNAVTQVQDKDTVLGSYTIMTKGLAVGTYYMPEYAGINAEGQALWYKPSDGEGAVTTEYGELTSADYKVFGSSFRDLEGSWSNTLRYKNVDVNFTFTFGLGGKYYDQTYASLVGGGIQKRGTAMHADLLNSFHKDLNPEGTLPAFSWGASGENLGSVSSRFLISNSFLRLRNVNIGYSLSSKFLNKASIRSARVYLAADNVLNFAARQGVDVTSAFFGVSDFTYFPMRTVVLGVNLGL